ncbi:MAG TPA: hypothetical protein VHC21_01330 [Candidatus Saccharimonadales bacterium]|nr:hypothetical protein [Candidatus Saccharimonadales bacterium]HVX56642.1 hypothetical protein [Candidatus Saccharimonadales bacterium]
MPERARNRAARPADIDAESRLLDLVLNAYEEGSAPDCRNKEFVEDLHGVCAELAAEGRSPKKMKELLRGAFIDAEALRGHIQESPAVPSDSGRAQPLNQNQARFVTQTMTGAYLPHIKADGTYDMAAGAERADATMTQLCMTGYDREAVRLLAAEALTHASQSIAAISNILPENFHA